MKHNHEVFERYRLMPRRLVDVGTTGIDISPMGVSHAC
jgi:hypothetical protein